MNISKSKRKEVVSTILIFLGAGILSIPLYYLGIIMIGFSVDSGDKQIAMLYPLDTVLLLFITFFIFILVCMLKIVVFLICLIPKITNSGFFNRKIYLYCFIPIFVCISVTLIKIHGDFSIEAKEARRLAVKDELGYITETSPIYKMANKYLLLNNIDDMKRESKKDRIVLLDEYDDILDFLSDINYNLESKFIYADSIYEDSFRERLRIVTNKIENDKLSVEEVHSEMENILDSRITRKNGGNDRYEEGFIEREFGNVLFFELNSLKMKLEQLEDDDIETTQMFSSEYAKLNLIRIEKFSEYKIALKEKAIYRDYIDLLVSSKGIDELNSKIDIISKKYNIDTNNQIIRDFINIIEYR